MKKLTPKEKKSLLAKFFKLSVLLGYSLEAYVGMNLSSFNFDLVQQQITRLNEMYENPENRYYA